jgi:hypothetical protein
VEAKDKKIGDRKMSEQREQRKTTNHTKNTNEAMEQPRINPDEGKKSLVREQAFGSVYEVAW